MPIRKSGRRERNVRSWHFCDMARDVTRARFKPGSGHLYSAPGKANYEFTA